MRIYGAGMAGLLTAHMLRRHQPIIYEAAESLPNNHAALLRFRSDAVSQATGIPFKKVTVSKAISFHGMLYSSPDLLLNNMYSQKVTGEIANRSILKLDTVERYIAPPDFISQLARTCQIAYGRPLQAPDVFEHTDDIISTIPMDKLMDMVKWDRSGIAFKSRRIVSITATIVNPIDVYQTIYFPGNEVPWYRVSITGNKLIVEIADVSSFELRGDDGLTALCEDILAMNFGIYKPIVTDTTYKCQDYGKLTPIDEKARKQFILAMTDQYRVYSIGRFATWRQLLLDDVVKDVEVVENFITERDSYRRKIK